MLLQLKTASRTELDQSLKSLFINECEILSNVLRHLIEIETRKLYLDYAYPSLFEYLTKHIGYSAGSAQRRIDAARLSREVPETLGHIEKGSLSLAQASLVQRCERQVKSVKQKVSSEAKRQLIADLENKTFQESEVLVKKSFNIESLQSSKISHQQDESIRLEITLSKKQFQKLNRMRELLSNLLPHGSWDQVLEYVSDKVIKQKDKARIIEKGASKSSPRHEINQNNQHPRQDSSQLNKIHSQRKSETSKLFHRTHIPNSIQRKIYNRDQCCQYIDKLTGKKCTATWQLTLDHIHPLWAGGTNSEQNLRVLCANHNRGIYKNQASLRQICSLATSSNRNWR